MVEPIPPAELSRRLEAGESFVLVDVREHEELAICRIDGALHIPLGELPRRAVELDPSRPTVLVCHHGIRSASAAAYLESLDFDSVFNLTGGVDRWADEVDPGMERY